VKNNLKNKLKFLKNKKIYFYISIILIEILLIFIFNKKGYLDLEKEDFRWLFSATAQSMAALFALNGIFLSFIFESLNYKIRSYREIIKNDLKFLRPISNRIIESWPELEIEEKANKLVEDIKNSSYNIMISGLTVKELLKELDLDSKIYTINMYKKREKELINKIKIPLFLIIFTFIISLIFIPFSSIISNLKLKHIYLSFYLIIVTITILNIYFYFLNTILLSKYYHLNNTRIDIEEKS